MYEPAFVSSNRTAWLRPPPPLRLLAAKDEGDATLGPARPPHHCFWLASKLRGGVYFYAETSQPTNNASLEFEIISMDGWPPTAAFVTSHRFLLVAQAGKQAHTQHVR